MVIMNVNDQSMAVEELVRAITIYLDTQVDTTWSLREIVNRRMRENGQKCEATASK